MSTSSPIAAFSMTVSREMWTSHLKWRQRIVGIRESEGFRGLSTWRRDSQPGRSSNMRTRSGYSLEDASDEATLGSWVVKKLHVCRKYTRQAMTSSTYPGGPVMTMLTMFLKIRQSTERRQGKGRSTEEAISPTQSNANVHTKSTNALSKVTHDRRLERQRGGEAAFG